MKSGKVLFFYIVCVGASFQQDALCVARRVSGNKGQPVALTQALTKLTLQLGTLKKMLSQTKPAQPVVPSPPQPKPPAPPAPSAPRPKFIKSNRFVFAQDVRNTGLDFIIGTVEENGSVNLVMYGPELTGAKPEDFIHGDKLGLPVSKATKIVWNPQNKVINPGPSATFVLIQGAGLGKQLQIKEQEEQKQQEKQRELKDQLAELKSKVTKSIPRNLFIGNFDLVDAWVDSIKAIAALCKQAQANPAVYALVLSQIAELGQEAQTLYSDGLRKVKDAVASANTALQNIQEILAKQKAGGTLTIKERTQIQPAEQETSEKTKKTFLLLQQKMESSEMTQIMDELKTCAQAMEELIKTQQKAQENPLEKFYQAYIQGTAKLDDWWVETEPAKKEPEKTKAKPEVDIDALEDELDEAYYDYKDLKTIEEREKAASKILPKLKLYVDEGGDMKTLRLWYTALNAQNYTIPPLPTGGG